MRGVTAATMTVPLMTPTGRLIVRDDDLEDVLVVVRPARAIELSSVVGPFSEAIRRAALAVDEYAPAIAKPSAATAETTVM
jgi:hypothetical protein